MRICFLGIDPGVTGAVGVICSDPPGCKAAIADLPVTAETFLANQSKSLDIPEFAALVENAVPPNCDYVVLATEQMQSMGFKTPARTLTMLAEMAGSIEAVVRMVCRQRGIPLFIRKYQPKTWMRWLFPDGKSRIHQKTEAKKESLEKARELFPGFKDDLKLQKHHDRAEALLLAFVALAETQGCGIDPTIKTMSQLADVYLSHKQDAKEEKAAKFTDVFEAKLSLPKEIDTEIMLKKCQNS